MATAAATRRDLRPHAAAVVEARKLADMRAGRTDPKYEKRLWATLLPHVQATRDVARLHFADSALLAYDHEFDAAIESCRATLGAGRSIGDEPFLISQLVQIAIISQTLASTERVLNLGVASDEALARLQSDLLAELDQPRGLPGMRGERAMMDDVFGKLVTGEVTIRDARGMSPNGSTDAAEWLASASSAFIRYNHGLALNRMNEAVEIAKRPAHEQPILWDEWESRNTSTDSLVTKIASSLSREAVPAVSGSIIACLRSRAQIAAMILVIAAERHRVAHGEFPDRIEAIDSRFRPPVLLDPFSGKPFVYSLEAGRLTVYSVSYDPTDDGGREFELRKWRDKGPDLGYRLEAHGRRSRPPQVQTLPEDVFPRRADDEEEPDEI